MSRILAIDTSSEACSVALARDDEIVERFEIVRQSHSARILPMVEALLADAGIALAQLDAIAFGRGPGSFTALRIGAGVVQGLAFAVDLPVVPVSSLAALAQGVAAPRVLAAVDARMGQVYWAACRRDDAGLVVLQGAEAVSVPETVTASGDGEWVGAGSGWDQYAERLQRALAPRVSRWEAGRHPHAREVALLGVAAYARGERVPPEEALPVYVRDDVARKSSP